MDMIMALTLSDQEIPAPLDEQRAPHNADVEVHEAPRVPRPRKRAGAFGAKLALIRAAGYPIRLAPGEPRSLTQRGLLDQADAVWHAQIRLARALRGIPVRLPGQTDVAGVRVLRRQMWLAEDTLAELALSAALAS
jgi:hypothetical protein